MRLTNRSEYALLALALLGRHPDELLSGEHIADTQGIPKRFLQQILLTLQRGGLVSSYKGKGGGYRLARAPKDISLAEVVRLFEGPLAPSRSASRFFYESTPIEREKGILRVMKDVRALVAEKLERTKLEDVL